METEVKPQRGRPPTNGLISLVQGRYPKACGWVKATVARYRRAVEAEILTRKERVDVIDASFVQTACRYEGTALLCQRWLRMRWEEFDDTQKLQWLLAISKASEGRDKALLRLG